MNLNSSTVHPHIADFWKSFILKRYIRILFKKMIMVHPEVSDDYNYGVKTLNFSGISILNQTQRSNSISFPNSVQ